MLANKAARIFALAAGGLALVRLVGAHPDAFWPSLVAVIALGVLV